MYKKLLQWVCLFIVVLNPVMALKMKSNPARAAGSWYVAPGGNDSLACTSPGTACLTINSALGKASPGDTIYTASGTYTDSGSEVVSIAKDITLSGGWDMSFMTQNGTSIVDGQDSRRGIVVSPGVTVIIDRFTIQSGRAEGAAGISNNGNLTLIESTVRDNYDMGDWTSEGGGIRNGDQGTLTLDKSTVMENESSSGAGVFNAWGTLIVKNSTISGNSARGFGGGINNLGGLVYLNNVMISANTDDDGVAGGIHNEAGGNVYLKNTLIAENNGDGPDCNGSLKSSGYNLIGNMTGCSLSPADGDILGIDPRLNALGDYGGPTYTHSLQLRSLAINGGDPGGCSDHLSNPLDHDQRGYPRVNRCDIGAYEFQSEISQQFLPVILKPMQFSDNFEDNQLNTVYWTKYNDEPGVNVEESGGEIRISGTSSDSIWAWNGLGTAVFPKSDFQASVDYRLVNMTSERQRAGLRLQFNNGLYDFRIGYWDLDDIYYAGYRDGGGYHHLAGIPPFGDEGQVYHSLRIEFDASSNTAKGYVDNLLIGSLTADIFTSPMFVVFEQSSQIPGSFTVDCRFDNFKIAAGIN